MIRFIIINTKTKETIIREITPAQIKEFVHDGFDMFIPYQN